MFWKESWRYFKDNLKMLFEFRKVFFPIQEFDMYLSEINPFYVKFKNWLKNSILLIKTYFFNFQKNTKRNIKILSLKKARQNIVKSLLSLKFLLLIVIVALPFKEPLEDLLEIIITPIFAKIQSEKFIDICIFIGLVLYFFFYINKRIRFSDFIALLLISTVHFYYRFIEKRWIFVNFEIYPQFKYLDIIFLLPFPYIISLAIKILTANFLNFISLFKTPSTTNIYSGFYLDASIGQKEADLLGREGFAKTLSERISKTRLSESSLAVGILGEWGSGKTSFLDLIERHLDKGSIIIKFNPWINQDSKSIIKDFFNALSEELSKYHINVSPALKDYSDILSGVGDSNLNKILNPLLKFISQKESVASEFDKINTIIKSINKKIIIFIDDVDRLYKDEIIQVMKLIRNSANFSNTTFIVAYDRNYVTSAIKDINPYASKNYLEKIFQVEISLPDFENEKIQDKIKSLLEPHLLESDKQFLNIDDTDILPSLVSIFQSKNDVFQLNIISTLRDVTRFVNSFLLSYNQLKGEILFNDLFHVEALRVIYPDVHNLIFFEKNLFLNRKMSNNQEDWYYSLKSPNDKLTINNAQSLKTDAPYTIITYLQDYFNYNSVDITKIISLLNIIFPQATDYPIVKKLSVINSSSFERYSYYRLLDSDLPEKDFNVVLQPNISLDDFYKQIDKWIASGLNTQLARRFKSINQYDNKAHFEKIIYGIFYLGRKDGYNVEDLYKKLFYNYMEYINNNYYPSKGEYEDFIMGFLNNAPYPYVFDMQLIFKILENMVIDGPFFPFNKNTLDNLRIKYFKEYTQTANSFIDFNLWELYRQGYDVSRISSENGSFREIKTTNPEIKSIMMDLIKRKIDNFLYNLIGVDNSYGDKKLYTIRNSFIGQGYFFDTYQDFKEFLYKFNDFDYQNVKEFKEFYAKYEANGYNFIEFDLSENFKEVK